jgi:hypothetical protein
VSKSQEKTYVNIPDESVITAPSNHVFMGWSLIQPTGNYDID